MLPDLFLTLAEELARDGRPAASRTAISRAYYALFNVAERFLARMKYPRPKKDYHVKLQQRLLASGDPELAGIGSDLGDFHQERIQADYYMDDHFPENKNNAEAAVKKARSMIEAIEACPLHGERWKRIRASIAKANVTGTDNLVDLTSD